MSHAYIILTALAENQEALNGINAFLRRCEKLGELAHTIEIIDSFWHEELAGWKTVTIKFSGADAYPFLRSELAELVDEAHSDVSVLLLEGANPESSNETDLSQVAVVYFRKEKTSSDRMICHTDCNVQLTHIPTGIVARAQDSRSRHTNYAEALSLLRARLQGHKSQSGRQ